MNFQRIAGRDVICTFFCQNDLILHKQLTLDFLLIAKVHVLLAEK